MRRHKIDFAKCIERQEVVDGEGEMSEQSMNSKGFSPCSSILSALAGENEPTISARSALEHWMFTGKRDALNQHYSIMIREVTERIDPILYKVAVN